MSRSRLPTDILVHLEDLASREKTRQDSAYQALIVLTRQPVPWAYLAWDQIRALAMNGDNRQRSICGQLLSNLALSDPDLRILREVPLLIHLTRDEHFVTARHTLLSLWKVAAAGPRQRAAILEGLDMRFRECDAEKNRTLIRYDIQCVLRKIDDLAPNPALRALSQELIALEADPKYQKKYQSAWRPNSAPHN